MKRLLLIGAALGGSLLSDAAVAQSQYSFSAAPQRVQTQYQPRVYNTPPPYFSQNQYSTAFGTAGAVAGLRGGPVASITGGSAGVLYGEQRYNFRNNYNQQQYYAPRAYGMQTTTPYQVRTVPRR